MRHGAVQILIPHLFQFISREHTVPGAADPELPCDGKGGIPMVAGDHHRADPCLPAGVDRLCHLLARRIDHPDRAQEDELPFDVRFLILRHLRQNPAGKAEYAQRAFRHPVAGRQDAFPNILSEGNLPRRGMYTRTPIQQLLYRALGIGDIFPSDSVHCRHALTAGVKRLFKQARILILQHLMVDPEPPSQIQQGSLRRVPDDLAGVIRIKARIIAQRSGIHHLFQCGIPLQILGHGGSIHLTGGVILINLFYGHFIERERPGFITANHGGAPKRLYGRQLADQRILTRHAPDAQRHDNRRRSGEALRDNGDRQRNCHKQLRHHRPAIQCANGEDQHTDHHAYCGEHLAHCIQLTFQRCVRVILAVEHGGNIAHLGLHPRGDNDALRTSIGDNRGGIGHIAPVGQRARLRRAGVRILFHRDGLTRQGGLLDFEIGRVD